MSGGGLQGLRLVAGAWHSSADRAAEADGKAEPRADVLLPLSLLPHAGAFPAEVPLRLSAGLARQLLRVSACGCAGLRICARTDSVKRVGHPSRTAGLRGR